MPGDASATDLNINEHVLRAVECIRPEIASENIYFSLVMLTDLWTVTVDPEETQQTLTTLVASSCDSLPEGGRITIETANLSLVSNDDIDDSTDLTPGDYVLVSISDTGPCPSETVSRRFIKSLHKNGKPGKQCVNNSTSIYDFVRESGGDIVLHNGNSAVHNGQNSEITVKLYFPRYSKPATTCRSVSEDELPTMSSSY